MPHRRAAHRLGRLSVVLWHNLAVVILIAVAVGGWYLNHRQNDQAADTRTLIRENELRIAEIQASRIVSCQLNYEAVRQLFRPFGPPKPTPLTRRFNRRVDTLKRSCRIQTRTRKVKP